MAETFETIKTKLGDWMAVDLQRYPEQTRGDTINFVQREVMRNHDLRFGEMDDTLALVATTDTYALPDEWRNPLSLWYVNPSTSARIDLIRIAKDEFDARHPDPTVTGSPVHYTIWGSSMYIGPTPNANVTLNRNWYGFLPDLANGSPDNTNAFVTQAWDVLFYGALSYSCMYLLEDTRAPAWYQQFKKLEMDLASQHQREKSSGRLPQGREPS